MIQQQKDKLYADSQHHVHTVGSDIVEQKQFVEISIKSLREQLQKGGLEDPEVLVSMLIHRQETKQQLSYSYNTPYFVRCDVKFDDEDEVKTLYFGRFPFTNASIYSWIAPAASIRFESPGRFSYILPSGEQRSGELLRKDQFMIVDQKIIFMSSESEDYERELIYQEYFTEQEKGFALPEIVEQMEKAQDKIIRANFSGSFLIAGAAGSGKTTLALHRVAYLVQSPETSELFPPTNIIVFVQDALTKKYFSGLLPELGIYRVKIVTFYEWAMRILEIDDAHFVNRFGASEVEKDEYEFAKKNAVDSLTEILNEKNKYTLLEKVYGQFFSEDLKSLWKLQIQKKLFDRFDLTLLLKNKLLIQGELDEEVEKYVKQKTTGKYVMKKVIQPLNYSLIVIDEAENYLSEQLRIFKTCIDSKTNALVYVGDLIQQTHLWTIKDWNDVEEQFGEDRQVMLSKVYRNTKQILEYIQSVGYEITIPASIKEGESVTERFIENEPDEMLFVRDAIGRNDKPIGILAKTSEYLEEYKKMFLGKDNVYVMTINEAQGVEFDTVFLVGVSKELYSIDENLSEITIERKRVNRDLLYVGLTRAMNRLYVLGNITIKELLNNFDTV